MISQRISDDKPPQLKILNMVIPILMRFYSLISNLSVASRIEALQIKCDINNDVKQFLTVYRGCTVANFDVIQSDVALQKQVHKNLAI